MFLQFQLHVLDMYTHRAMLCMLHAMHELHSVLSAAQLKHGGPVTATHTVCHG